MENSGVFNIDSNFCVTYHKHYDYVQHFTDIELNSIKDTLKNEIFAVKTNGNRDIIYKILGKNIHNIEFENKGIDIIIFHKTLKRYNEITLGKHKMKYLVCNDKHLYNGKAYEKLFTLSQYKIVKVNGKDVKKYNSLRPHKFRFQVNDFSGIVLVDLKNNLLFYNLSESFEINKPSGKFEKNFLGLLDLKVDFQLFHQNHIPFSITGFQLKNKKILLLNFQLSSLHLVDNLMQYNNTVYVTTNNYICKNQQFNKMLYSKFLLKFEDEILIVNKNNETRNARNLICLTQNLNDYVLKSILVLNLLSFYKIDLNNIISKSNIKEIKELINNFEIVSN
jgi:hypothetical protein